MLTRLTAESWFTLRHFDARPGRVAVMLPDPGQDPTDPLDLLETLRDFVIGGGYMARKMFPRRSLPPTGYFSQSFEFELGGAAGTFWYHLDIAQDRRRDYRAIVDMETLWHEGRCVSTYVRGALYEDMVDDEVEPDERLPRSVDRMLSAIAQLDAVPDPRLAEFRQLLARIELMRVDPMPEPQEADAHALLQRVREAVRRPETVLAVIVPDDLLAADLLAPWLSDIVAASLAGGAQLLLASAQPALLAPFAAAHGVRMDVKPTVLPPKPASKTLTSGRAGPAR